MVKSFTFLLVHSPLVGPLTWESTATCLREQGQRVVVPSLAAAVDEGPPYYRACAEAAGRVVDGHGRRGPVVVVGHSGAGALLPAIAEVVGPQARGAVFVDALLPHPGESWFDTVPGTLREELTCRARDGRLPPWNEWFPANTLERLLPDERGRARFVAELRALPVAYFAEPAPEADWPADRCAYVRLSEAYDHEAEEAERRGWRVYREDADHLAMLTQPERIADVVVRVAAGVVG